MVKVPHNNISSTVVNLMAVGFQLAGGYKKEPGFDYLSEMVRQIFSSNFEVIY